MIATLILTALAVWITAWLLPGITIEPWYVSIIVAVVMGLINALIRPCVKLLSLPINIVTLGLFTFVINALMVELCAWVVNGFEVSSFWWALLFSLVLSLVTWFLGTVFGKKIK
ncbi:MAG: phage holin family protein [Muribaculaceae bacterium]|nr:phage holin family protein [Muribaculaceae bacterium]